MNLVILVSGRGSRLKKKTKSKPKCLTKIHKNKTIIDFISECFCFAKNIIFVTGYKSHHIKNHFKNHFKNKNINYVKNENYMKTNMVESLMLSKKKLKKEEILILYGDILFDKKIIYELIKIKGNVLPLNSNWLELWKRFKTLDAVKQDAENVVVSKNKIKIIGTKIIKNYPNINIWVL